MVRMADILKKVEERRLQAEKDKAAEETAETQDQARAPAQEQEQAKPAESAPEQTTEKIPAPPTKVEPPPAQAQQAPPGQNVQTRKPPVSPGDQILGAAEKVPQPSKHGLRISRPVMEKAGGLNNEEAIHLYLETLDTVKDIFGKVREDIGIVDEDKNIPVIVEKFVDQQLLDNDNIIGLISLPPQKDYLFNHVINICIISVEIGIGLGYNKSELIDLGTAAILCYIGLVKFSELYNQPRQLNKEELEKIREHTSVSFEILEKFKHVSKRVATVAYQLHERQNGSGYPCGLQSDSIDEYVKIIGVADIYDAVSHPRPYRQELQPYEALNLVIKSKDALGPKGVKAFIERVCCPYPIGCYVKLSSAENGMVVGRNIGASFRPIVEIIYNVNREGSEITRLIDLKKSPTIYIKDYITREEMQKMF